MEPEPLREPNVTVEQLAAVARPDRFAPRSRRHRHDSPAGDRLHNVDTVLASLIRHECHPQPVGRESRSPLVELGCAKRNRRAVDRQRPQVSVRGGRHLVIHERLTVGGDGDRMMVAEVVPGPEGAVGATRVLFEGVFAPDPVAAGVPNYDVSPAGQRFVMVAGSGSGFGATAQGLVLVETLVRGAEAARACELMPLQPGTRLGAYQVTAKIGEGGEVYRARDTKLDRDVALKVLPQAFTSDPDRLARFEREAKVLASLNHPNIGHIYGLEEAEGQKALVLELVEGDTLADRIAEGPIPINDTLPIAKQIAEALEAAHEQGIIHQPTGLGWPSASRQVNGRSGRSPGHRMDGHCSSIPSVGRPVRRRTSTSGPYPIPSSSPLAPCSRRVFWKAIRRCRPTDDGSPTPRMNPEHDRSTCSGSPIWASAGRSRPTAAMQRSGHQMGRSCSIARPRRACTAGQKSGV